MYVRNRDLANQQHVGLPDGTHVDLDAHGEGEASDTCGLFARDGSPQVPGWDLLEGTPVTIPQRGGSRVVDGPRVACFGPRDMANQQTGCPDGRTTAVFDQDSVALVPDTCKLDQLPGYRFVSLDLVDVELARVAEVPNLAVPVAPVTVPLNLEVVRTSLADQPKGPPLLRVPTPQPTSHELPLVNPGPRPGGVEGGTGPENRPLVPASPEELEAVAHVEAQARVQAQSQEPGAADLPDAPATPPVSPQVAAQLEGASGVDTGLTCRVCGRPGFKSARGLEAHMNSHARSLPTAVLSGPAPETHQSETPAEPAPELAGETLVAVVEPSPAPNPEAAAAALAAATAAIDQQ